ncbi:fluoride efflux transporter CrcB [Peribacillus glennii]|uniref:Fluoride-specific ion channel FluC n=1 Tax=Peribacillus glennii TaxID=2303991 RepID=A0A372LAZ9_9BACI|nr:fluoride efflux transporter CrcB [Peribacillus glennii]RFU62043.1 fluoride efflux transporter CrcB [Peribacillus glennii]
MIWLIGAGGAIGAAARYFLGAFINSRGKRDFPIGTWLVNITGSLLLGVLTGLYVFHYLPQWIWFLLGIGFCGAYTTFSTFSTENMALIEKSKYRLAMSYLISSVLIGILAAGAGYFLVVKLIG